MASMGISVRLKPLFEATATTASSNNITHPPLPVRNQRSSDSSKPSHDSTPTTSDELPMRTSKRVKTTDGNDEDEILPSVAAALKVSTPTKTKKENFKSMLARKSKSPPNARKRGRSPTPKPTNANEEAAYRLQRLILGPLEERITTSPGSTGSPDWHKPQPRGRRSESPSPSPSSESRSRSPSHPFTANLAARRCAKLPPSITIPSRKRMAWRYKTSYDPEEHQDRELISLDTLWDEEVTPEKVRMQVLAGLPGIMRGFVGREAYVNTWISDDEREAPGPGM